LKIPITTAELPNKVAAAAPNEPNPAAQPREEDANKFGLQVQELTKDVATRLKLNVQQGVIVTDVADNSIAAAQDIQREDVITEVDGKVVTNVATFREALNKSDPRKGILLYLDRKGSKTFAVLKANP
jgi:S1-C subfamily serine protease